MKQTKSAMTEDATDKPVPAKYFEDQFDDEEVLFVFRKHPIVMRRGLIIGLLAWLIGPIITLVLTYTQPNNPPTMAFFGLSLLISIAVGIILLIPSWISWYFSVFIVTDQRFIQITQRGLFHRAVADLGLKQIQSVNYEVDGFQATLLGFGTMNLRTYVGDLTIHEVHHPAKIQKQLLDILRKEGIEAEAYPVATSKAQADSSGVHEETEAQEDTQEA